MEESAFRFLGYRISKIECEIQDHFNKRENRFIHTVQVQQNYDEYKERFVEVVLDIKVTSEDKAFYFFLTIKGGFESDSDMSPKLFQIMSAQNAPAILFPFARAIITSYTAQANIPPLILPTMNFTDQSKS